VRPIWTLEGFIVSTGGLESVVILGQAGIIRALGVGFVIALIAVAATGGHDWYVDLIFVGAVVLLVRQFRLGSRVEVAPAAAGVPAELENTDTSSLLCAECGVGSSPDAADWKAYLDADGQVVTFCPECAEPELDAG
jgi:hypothetical protein